MGLALLFTVALPYLTNLATGQSVPNPGCSLLASPPPNSICNVSGRITPQDYTHSLQLPGIRQCSNLCLRRRSVEYVDGSGDCGAYSFNATNSMCTLYSYIPAGTFTADRTSKVVFAETRCFNCAGTCPSTNGVNALDNSGFEYGNDLWPWTQDRFQDASAPLGKASKPGLGSTTAYSASITGPDRSSPELRQSFNACKATLYMVEFAYKTVCRGRCKLVQYVATGDSSVTSLGDSQTPSFITNGTWATFKDYLYVTSPLGPKTFGVSSLGIRHENRDDAGPASSVQVLIDNASVAPVNKDLSVPTSSKELVTNGNFESGKLSPWTINGNTGPSVRQPGIGSKYGLHYSANRVTGQGDYQIVQDLTAKLVPSAEYVLSFNFQASNVTSISFALYNRDGDPGRSGSQLSFGFQACIAGYAPCSGQIKRPFVARFASVRLDHQIIFQII